MQSSHVNPEANSAFDQLPDDAAEPVCRVRRLGVAVGTGVITALLSSIMNNIPTVLIGALSINATTSSGVVREAMIYADIISRDLGPKITPTGSLVTLLWLHVLSSKDIHISWGYYFSVGIALTLPVLLLTLTALALRLS